MLEELRQALTVAPVVTGLPFGGTRDVRIRGRREQHIQPFSGRLATRGSVVTERSEEPACPVWQMLLHHL